MTKKKERTKERTKEKRWKESRKEGKEILNAAGVCTDGHRAIPWGKDKTKKKERKKTVQLSWIHCFLNYTWDLCV